MCPNPFYQIYEGAALLAGAEPAFLNQTADNGFDLDLDSLTDDEWRRTQLIYVCSPGNPTGRVLDLDGWRALFERADRYGFVIASDECYSEIYPDEAGAAARRPGGGAPARAATTSATWSCSPACRSARTRPGLRSGGVAGDAALLERFLLYRTYHGCAMSLAVQHASIAAWSDEAHVRDNRAQYREKFAAVVPMLEPVLDDAPAGRRLLPVGAACRAATTRRSRADLFAATHVTVLPGRYLAREAHGVNPGTRLRAHRARARNRRLRRGRATHRGVLPLMADQTVDVRPTRSKRSSTPHSSAAPRSLRPPSSRRCRGARSGHRRS